MTDAEVQVYSKEKPRIYTADGREVTVRKPVGFANHPAVPTTKLKGGQQR
jgi:hypothetical protein